MPTKPPSQRGTRQQQQEAYDKRRGTARQRGYGSAWDRASTDHRIEHPLCLGCEAAGLVVPATLVDHVEPHRGNRVKFWDRSKWQSSCDWHHNVVKPRLEAMWDRGQIEVSALWLDSPTALALAASLR